MILNPISFEMSGMTRTTRAIPRLRAASIVLMIDDMQSTSIEVSSERSVRRKKPGRAAAIASDIAFSWLRDSSTPMSPTNESRTMFLTVSTVTRIVLFFGMVFRPASLMRYGRDWLAAARSAQYFSQKSIKVLFVGGDDDVLNSGRHLGILECLRPGYDGSNRGGSQANGQAIPRQRGVLHNDLRRRFNFREHIFVRIVCAIGSVHDERPTAAILEFADTKGIGEAGWSPPTRQAFRVADRGEDLFWGRWDFAGCAEGSHRILE